MAVFVWVKLGRVDSRSLILVGSFIVGVYNK